MNLLAFLKFLTLIFVATLATGAQAKAASVELKPGGDCSKLGETTMSTKHDYILACLLTTGSASATTCDEGGGCIWKAMQAQAPSNPSGPKCFDFALSGGTAVSISELPAGTQISSIVKVITSGLPSAIPYFKPQAGGLLNAMFVNQGKALVCQDGYFRTSCAGYATEHKQDAIFWGNACVVPNDVYTHLAISCCKE